MEDLKSGDMYSGMPMLDQQLTWNAAAMFTQDLHILTCLSMVMEDNHC